MSSPSLDSTAAIAAEVTRAASQASLPNGTSGHNFRKEADAARRSYETAAGGVGLTWFHAARAAFWAAMSQTDNGKLRAALIHLAAVIVAWIEDLDRRAGQETTKGQRRD